MSLEGTTTDAAELLDILRAIVLEIEAINKALGASTTKEAGDVTAKTFITVSQTLMISRRLLAILQRSGFGGKDADQIIALAIQMQQVFMMLYRSMWLITLGTPYGWVMGGLGIVTMTLMGDDFARQGRY